MQPVPDLRWQLSLDLRNDPALRERVEAVMRQERRKKRADFVRAAVEAYVEAAEQRLGIHPAEPFPSRPRAGRTPGA